MQAVLILESTPVLSKELKLLLGNSKREIISVSSIAEAKQSLLKKTPAVFLFGLDHESGDALSFASGLQAHPLLKEIPIVLSRDAADPEFIAKAKAAGIAAVVSPKSEPLRQSLLAFIPELLAPAPRKQERTPATPGNVTLINDPPELLSTREQHFQIAQKLLAQVLHNLKTSNLLDVASPEDVPRVVSEITRKVCQEAGREKPAQSAQGGSDTVDLGSAFGKKR